MRVVMGGTFSRIAFRGPVLSFPVLTAATPPEVELSLTDEALQPVDYDKQVDLVGLSVLISYAPKAYRIADHYRRRGIKVVLGGPHPTALPQEAIQHADAVVTGEGELVWPRLLEDLAHDRLQRFYHGGYVADLAQLPPPRMDLFNLRRYSISTLNATRGCPNRCSYCGNFAPFRMRPVERIVEEMENADGNLFTRRFFLFMDDNLTANRRYFRELMGAVAPLRKRWITQAPLGRIAADDATVALAADSGCRLVLCGIESFNQEALRGANKPFNRVSAYRDQIKRLHDHGIFIDAFVMVGFDEDDRSTFEEILEKTARLEIDAMSLFILTPYPTTPLFDKLESEGRLLHKDWSRYDSHHVVFRPRQMSPDELYEGWLWVRKEFARFGTLTKRVWRARASPWIPIANNIFTASRTREFQESV